MFRQYLTKKNNVGLSGCHLDFGPNFQKEFEQPKALYNTTFGMNTIIGYQNKLFNSRFICDLGIGASWTIDENAPLYKNFVYPRMNISLGYKIKR